MSMCNVKWVNPWAFPSLYSFSKYCCMNSSHMSDDSKEREQPHYKHKKEKKCQGNPSRKSVAWVFLGVPPGVFFHILFIWGCFLYFRFLEICEEFVQQYLEKQCNDGRVHGMTRFTLHIDIFTFHHDGRNISRIVASLNIFLHDVINLLYYSHWTDKQKKF